MNFFPEINLPVIQDTSVYSDLLDYCIRYKVSVFEMKSANRSAGIVRHRVKFSQEMRSKGRTYQEIADALKRDHTTIVHYINHYNE